MRDHKQIEFNLNLIEVSNGYFFKISAWSFVGHAISLDIPSVRLHQHPQAGFLNKACLIPSRMTLWEWIFAIHSTSVWWHWKCLIKCESWSSKVQKIIWQTIMGINFSPGNTTRQNHVHYRRVAVLRSDDRQRNPAGGSERMVQGNPPIASGKNDLARWLDGHGCEARFA